MQGRWIRFPGIYLSKQVLSKQWYFVRCTFVVACRNEKEKAVPENPERPFLRDYNMLVSAF